jgi:xanthine dehydrogenase accessory factor
MREVFHEICQALLNGQELAVASIISDRGSTPRSSGSKMIVYPNGDISGTIGGGAIEGDVIQRALRLFETRGADIVSYDLNRKANIQTMDVICGGQIQVLIEHLPVHEKTIDLYQTAQEEFKKSRSFFWIGKITDDNGKLQVAHAIQKAQNEFIGPLQVKHEFQKLIESGARIYDGSCCMEVEGHSYVIESIQPPDTIFLLGAGHVSRELAALSKKVDFRTIVFDDRAEFANPNRFPDADEIRVCPEFTEVFKESVTNAGDYIVIMTRGHSFDQEVLAQALQTEAGYIGMIGSRRKREAIYRELIDRGIAPSALEQVRCPIGLAIDAETPAEIAVSIMAQLIQHRARGRNHEEH